MIEHEARRATPPGGDAVEDPGAPVLAVVDVSAVVPAGGSPPGDVQVVLVGDLVEATRHAARRELEQCLQRATRRLTLDLERTRVDASGAPTLRGLLALADSRGVQVELRAVDPALRALVGQSAPQPGRDGCASSTASS